MIYPPKVFQSSILAITDFGNLAIHTYSNPQAMAIIARNDSPHQQKSPYVTSLLICFQDVLKYMGKARWIPARPMPCPFRGASFYR